MRILIFGRNGQIARTLKNEAGAYEVAALGREHADLMEQGAAQKAIKGHAPDIIINAAAYTAVDRAEDEKETAQRLNHAAAAEIARAASQAGAHLIHISTDYVFDGEKTEPYLETDETRPLSVYGKSKCDGEEAVLEAFPEAIIIRTSWVFSEFGENFVKTMLRLAGERNTLNIVDDQIGGPTSACDIARAALVIAGKKHRGAPGAGIYHFQGSPAVSWAAFAAKIFEISGAEIAINPIATRQYPTPAQRPLNTVLDCAKMERDFGVAQPDWRASLRQVLADLNTKDPSS